MPIKLFDLKHQPDPINWEGKEIAYVSVDGHVVRFEFTDGTIAYVSGFIEWVPNKRAVVKLFVGNAE